MPYFFVDDAFSDSKEVMSIPARHRLAAVGLWTLCGSWSANKLTNGEVPNEVLARFLGRLDRHSVVVAVLVESTLWERTETGVKFTNWAKWQRTREQVISYRQWEAERKREQRKRRQVGGKPATNLPPTVGKLSKPAEDNRGQDSPSQSVQTRDDDEMSHRDSCRDVEKCPGGSPVTPIPIPERSTTQVGTEVTLGRGSGGRGSRLPDDWMPPTEVVAQMRSDHPHVNLKSEHEKFIDYWHAQPGAKGRKADWPATWRNWIRRAAEQPTHRNGTPIATSDLRVAQTQALKSGPPSQRLELE